MAVFGTERQEFGAEALAALLKETFHSSPVSVKKVVYVVLPESYFAQAETEEDFVKGMQDQLAPLKDLLMTLNVRRITVAVNRSHLISMNYFTLRASLNFGEDSNIRHVEPALAYLLELKRITDHHEITLKYADAEGQVHIYLAKEKSNSRQAGSESVQKMFVSLLIRPNQMMRDHRTMLHFFPAARAILEQMFETLESVMAKEAWIPRVRDQFICSNHLFINIIAIFFHSAEEVAQVLEHLMRYYDERFNRLGIRSAEVAMNLIETHVAGPKSPETGADLRRSRELISLSQRIRVFFENNLGLVNATEMHAYRESHTAGGKLKLDCFWGKPKHNGSDAFASHAQTSDLELRRNRVLKLGSTYIYDFPQLFSHILDEIWGKRAGKPASEDLISFSEMHLNDTAGDGKRLNEMPHCVFLLTYLLSYLLTYYRNFD
jgi:acetyl-CoA carboxylase/biotin carboxylase 1